MRVVLDTNIIVSGLAYNGNERRLLNYARGGRFELCLSAYIIGEIRGVMPRKFGWSTAAVVEAIIRLARSSTIVEILQQVEEITGHPPDDRILDCVAAANADYLVTGDRRHLLPLGTFANARIVTAAEFLEELERVES